MRDEKHLRDRIATRNRSRTCAVLEADVQKDPLKAAAGRQMDPAVVAGRQMLMVGLTQPATSASTPPPGCRDAPSYWRYSLHFCLWMPWYLLSLSNTTNIDDNFAANLSLKLDEKTDTSIVRTSKPIAQMSTRKERIRRSSDESFKSKIIYCSSTQINL